MAVSAFVCNGVQSVENSDNIVLTDAEGNTILIDVSKVCDKFAEVAVSKSLSYCTLLYEAEQKKTK